ncbi:MAG: serine/threonine protein kinase [Planctomycetes bacterium]|nr:serine/threonine protein kinase [Planctomycetota bacterium]
MSACPPQYVLEDAAVGKSCDDEAITSHVAQCPACCRALEDIRLNNSVLTEIRAVRRSARPYRDRRLTPPVVEDYEILECVAQGGQGLVYRAIQKRTKRCVALKLLLGGHFATSRQRSRFEREVELAARLHHPNIVTVHDSGITPDGRPFLSMAFIEGRPLDQWARSCNVDNQRTVTIRRLISVIVKVCNALSYAHLRGVLHRDLKPGNILVDANDEPHIVDFGLAKMVDGEAGFNATVTGEFMGTIAYAAPEQVSSGDCHSDVRSDVYALGVLLYEVLTGRLPYPMTGAIAEVVRQITTLEPPKPSTIDSSVSTDLETIVLKAMTKDVNRRYQSARDLGEDLRRFLANEPIIARSDSTWYVLRKAAEHHRRAIITSGLSFLVLLMSGVAGGIYLILGAQADTAKARAVAESERAEAISLVLHSASSPRYLNKELKGYRFRDLVRLEEQINLGWLAANKEREAAASSLLAAIYCKGRVPWSAEDLIRQTNMKRSLDVDSMSSRTSRGYSDLAEVLLARLRLSEASHYCDLALRIDRNARGDQSLEVARNMGILARIRLAQGDMLVAVKLATDAIAIHAVHLGTETEEIAQCLDTRSAALLAIRDVDGAERDCLQALRLRFTLLQDEDPAVAHSIRRLAEVFDQRGKNAYLESLATALGVTTHREMTDQLRQLANDLDELCKAAGENTNAPQVTLQRLLLVKEVMLGPNHKGLLSTLAALVIETHEIGGDSEKLTILDHASRVIAHNYGTCSLPYANCLDERAGVLEDLHRYSEALETAKQSLDIWLGLPMGQRDEFKAVVIERTVAWWMMLDGQYEDAALHFGHCDEVVRRLHGQNHIISPYARAGRAWSLVRLGQTQGMEKEAREALAIANRLGPELPASQRSFITFCVGSVLTDLGKLDEGKQLLNVAWEGDPNNDPIRTRSITDRYRCLLVAAFIRNMVARGDSKSEVSWRKELPDNGHL